MTSVASSTRLLTRDRSSASPHACSKRAGTALPLVFARPWICLTSLSRSCADSVMRGSSRQIGSLLRSTNSRDTWNHSSRSIPHSLRRPLRRLLHRTTGACFAGSRDNRRCVYPCRRTLAGMSTLLTTFSSHAALLQQLESGMESWKRSCSCSDRRIPLMSLR